MKQNIQKYIEIAKTYLVAHKQDLKTATPIVLIVGSLAGVVAFAALHNLPNIVYQPVKACDLFTPSEAQDLLGDKVLSVDTKAPVISEDTAISKCSYTDSNPDTEKLLVAAIAVRSGINDKGVAQNKADFETSKPKDVSSIVTGIGESAYFNAKNGQLNVLEGRKWVILSYGVGNAPEANKVEQTVELAKKVLTPSKKS